MWEPAIFHLPVFKFLRLQFSSPRIEVNLQLGNSGIQPTKFT